MSRASTHLRPVTSPAVPEGPPGLFSNCLLVGDTVHVSGQHAGSPDGPVGGDDVYAQSKEAFRRVTALVAAAGGTPGDVVKLTIYVTDMARKADVSRARREAFDAHPVPCSTLVGVQALVEPGLLVEVEAVAVLPHPEGGRP